MFEALSPAPADPILGLTEAFKNDPSPNKINLGVGVYKDPSGVTPILECVKRAEQQLVENEQSKGYLGIDGHAQYCGFLPPLLFGDAVDRERIAVAQTPGGTGALRIVAEFISRLFPNAKIWRSVPTWANHDNVFSAAGLEIAKYRYYDAERSRLDFDGMMAELDGVVAGDIVLLHGCCHNPTGVDLTLEQWRIVGEFLGQRQAMPLVDFAYQGFAEGLEEDAQGLRSLLDFHEELLVCNSCSKNFGLYRERVGALFSVAKSNEAAATVLSQFKRVIRGNYSNPPSHGGAVVAQVLGDPQLTLLWRRELETMRNRINGMRSLFVERLNAAGVQRDFSFIKQQRGMFSFSGLTPDQVERLRLEHKIYIVRSGRINVAAITEDNVDRLSQAIAQVL